MIRRALSLAVGLCVLGSASAVLAQTTAQDPVRRYDVDEILEHHGHDDLPDEEALAGRRVLFDFSFTTEAASNIDYAPDDERWGSYVNAGLGLDLAPATVGAWEIGGGADIDFDHFLRKRDRDLGQARLEAFAHASRQAGEGAVTAELVWHEAFEKAFERHDYRVVTASFQYERPVGPLLLDLGVSREFSDSRGLRRTHLTAGMDYEWPVPALGHTLTLRAETDWSPSDDDGPDDSSRVLTALVFTAERPIGRAWSIAWEGALLKQFSDSDDAEFDNLILNVALERAF